LLDGDVIAIRIDSRAITGSVDLIGHDDEVHNAAWGAAELARRPSRIDLREAEQLPDDTRLWAALQNIGGGTWGGCVYDVEGILKRL
jgi:hypothetical protein